MSSVVVVGAVNVDLVVTADRLPAAGETVVGSRVVRNGGGKGANAAVAAAVAGVRVDLVGAVGADDFGRFALGDLHNHGVGTDHVAVLDSEATGTALIVVDGSGENQIAVGAGANFAVDPDAVEKAVTAAQPDCVLISTEIAGLCVVTAAEAAARLGVRCVLNPAPVLPEIPGLLRPWVVVTPNAGEARDLAVLMGFDPDLPLGQLAQRIAGATGATVVITRGAAGVVLAGPETGPDFFPAAPVDRVVDTTGAGDCFNGTLAARLAGGATDESAVRSAALAAAASVGQVGARPVAPPPQTEK